MVTLRMGKNTNPFVCIVQNDADNEKATAHQPSPLPQAALLILTQLRFFLVGCTKVFHRVFEPKMCNGTLCLCCKVTSSDDDYEIIEV